MLLQSRTHRRSRSLGAILTPRISRRPPEAELPLFCYFPEAVVEFGYLSGFVSGLCLCFVSGYVDCLGCGYLSGFVLGLCLCSRHYVYCIWSCGYLSGFVLGLCLCFVSGYVDVKEITTIHSEGNTHSSPGDGSSPKRFL